jgi:hypothetical protein
VQLVEQGVIDIGGPLVSRAAYLRDRISISPIAYPKRDGLGDFRWLRQYGIGYIGERTSDQRDLYWK